MPLNAETTRSFLPWVNICIKVRILDSVASGGGLVAETVKDDGLAVPVSKPLGV